MPKLLCAQDGCRVRLQLSAFACRCEKTFCPSHRPSTEHACPFDYKESAKQILLKTMSTSIIAKKVDVI